MNPYYIAGQFVGAAIACSVLLGLLRLGAMGWPRSYGKVLFLNTLSAIIAILLAAIGAGLSAASTPDFSAAPVYLLAQAAVGAVDFWRIRRSQRAGHTTAAARQEPRF